MVLIIKSRSNNLSGVVVTFGVGFLYRYSPPTKDSVSSESRRNTTWSGLSLEIVPPFSTNIYLEGDLKLGNSRRPPLSFFLSKRVWRRSIVLAWPRCLWCKLYLVSNPTRTSVCDANHLHFLYSLSKTSAASLLARDGGACAALPGLVAETGEPPRTSSIYATDTWSGRVGEAKYKRRDANDNKRGCKLRNAKCEVPNVKCEMELRLQLRMRMWMRCLPVLVSHLPYIFFPLLSSLCLFFSARRCSNGNAARRYPNSNSARLWLASPNCLTTHQSSWLIYTVFAGVLEGFFVQTARLLSKSSSCPPCSFYINFREWCFLYLFKKWIE